LSDRLKEENRDILVLGIGNLLLGDEGAGIEVINRLGRSAFDKADLLDGGTGGFHLLGSIESYGRLIIVDASLDQYPAGSVRVLHPRYAKDFPPQLSAHEIGLKDLLEALYIMGRNPDVWLVAISVKNFQEMGIGLSPEVEASISTAIERVIELAGNAENNQSVTRFD
jgi:hydrogenase maturation protease